MNKVFIFIITKKENNKANIDIGKLNNYQKSEIVSSQ